MTKMPYKDYRKISFRMPERPDVLKMVDTIHGVIYINQSAAEDAKIIIYISNLSAEYCFA